MTLRGSDMATPIRIRVMISSRCNDPIKFHGETARLSDVRFQLRKELEEVKLLDSQLFDVWINEDAPPAEGNRDSWETCLQQVREADIVLVLYNGNAGWAKEDGEIGICHAEYATALEISPAKVRIIELPLAANLSGKRHQRFQAYYGTQSPFRGAAAESGEDVITRCRQALREAVAGMVRLGVREARKGRLYAGAALDWSRLDYHEREREMKKALKATLQDRHGSTDHELGMVAAAGGKSILFCCHAVPAAMSQSGARELVGQPFLRDHELVQSLPANVAGPVHIIAAHRTVTESQALKMLGFPDAIVVFPPFGIYAADPVYKVQLVFIRNCADETSTRHGVQRFFEWLEQSGESDLLVERAQSRMRIVKTLAKELKRR